MKVTVLVVGVNVYVPVATNADGLTGRRCQRSSPRQVPPHCQGKPVQRQRPGGDGQVVGRLHRLPRLPPLASVRL